MRYQFYARNLQRWRFQRCLNIFWFLQLYGFLSIPLFAAFKFVVIFSVRFNFQIYSKQLSRSNGAPNSKEFTLVKDTERGTSTLSENLRRHHFRKGIPKITEPIPADWTVIEDDFLFVYAVRIDEVFQCFKHLLTAERYLNTFFVIQINSLSFLEKNSFSHRFSSS